MRAERLSTPSIIEDNRADLPGYCPLTFTLMPVGSTSQPSVHVLRFASIGPLTPLCRLSPLPVPQASDLPTASSRFHLAIDTLAAQLTLPLAGCGGDFHTLVSAPCPGAPIRKRPPVAALSMEQCDFIWKKDGVYWTSQRVKEGVRDYELRFAAAAAGGGYNAVLLNRFRDAPLFL